MVQTFLAKQFARLKKAGNRQGHDTIHVWISDDGYHASCNQFGGFVTRKKHKTPEAAIRHAMVCAAKKRP